MAARRVSTRFDYLRRTMRTQHWSRGVMLQTNTHHLHAELISFRTHFCRGQIAIVLANHHENCRSRSRFIDECSFCTNEHEIHLDTRKVSVHDDSDRFCLSMPLRTSSDMDNVSNCVNVQFLLLVVLNLVVLLVVAVVVVHLQVHPHVEPCFPTTCVSFATRRFDLFKKSQHVLPLCM